MMDRYTPEQIKAKIVKALEEAKKTYSKLVVECTSVTHWHMNITIHVTIKDNEYDAMRSVFFKGLHTGCGLVLMHGYPRYKDDGIMDVIIPLMGEHYAKDGAGTIICTLGGDDHNNCKDLLRWGFVPACSYPNLAHGKGYMQSVWQKTTKGEHSY